MSGISGGRILLVKLDAAAFVADPELIHALHERATPVDCTEDRVLFYQGEMADGLYIVQAGNVALSMQSPLGDTVMSISATPGSLLGLPGLVGNSAYSLTAKAANGAEIWFVGREQFSRLMLTEPSLSVMILKVLAAEVRNARQALAEI